MKNFIILILIALIFVGIEKIIQSQKNPNNTADKPRNSAVSKIKASSETQGNIPASSSKAQTAGHSAAVRPITPGLKKRLDTYSMKILNYAEIGDDTSELIYTQKMIDFGVTEMCQPQITEREPNSPAVLVIVVNGVKKSGHLKCAYHCYKYDGQKYETGYCK